MKTYSIKETFLTVQGEGSRAGRLSVFLRFAGCNLWNGDPEHRALGRGACARWCDTDFTKGTPMTAPQILEGLNGLWPAWSIHPRWCVLTGGEPGLQLDLPLMQALRDEGWRIAVETNGSLNNLAFKAADLLTVSPKRGVPFLLDASPEALELKVVLPGDAVQPWTDGEVLALARQLAPCMLYVQPQDPLMGAGLGESVLHTALPHAVPTEARAEYRANVARCFTFVQRHPDFGLSVQVHKYLALP